MKKLCAFYWSVRDFSLRNLLETISFEIKLKAVSKKLELLIRNKKLSEEQKIAYFEKKLCEYGFFDFCKLGHIPVLAWAIEAEYLELAKFLLENGFDVNAQIDICEDTPLILAIKHEHYDFAKKLIVVHKNKIDLNIKTLSDETALSCVITTADEEDALMFEIPQLLLDNGAYGDLKLYGAKSIIHLCIDEDAPIVYAKLLLDNGVGLSSVDIFGDTPLWSAVMQQKVEYVKLLIDYGADGNHKVNGLSMLEFLEDHVEASEVISQMILCLRDAGAQR